MRKSIALVSLTALAACGGGGPQTAGGSAVPGGSPVLDAAAHTFVKPTVAKTYSAIGGVQSYQYSTDDRDALPNDPTDPKTLGHQNGSQYAQLYAGNASTARNSAITVTYDPRDAIFQIKIADTKAGVDNDLRFQDPLHRTDFGDAREPQVGTPNIPGKGMLYLQVGSSDRIRYDASQSLMVPVGNATGKVDRSTFFYQKPGTTTQYVTYAGFVHNATSIVEVTAADGTSTYLRQNNTLERAAFVFGERTDNNAVPKTGTAVYTGDLLATMVYNNLVDTQSNSDTYYQWITGSQSTTVDFGASKFTTTFTGTVKAPQMDVYSSGIHALPENSVFNAKGGGRIDLVNAGGFLGEVTEASFTAPSTIVNPPDPTLTTDRRFSDSYTYSVAHPVTTAIAGAKTDVAIAGSSIDGAFYGPGSSAAGDPAANVEVGGGFRIVGGTPDERIDILGSFTGKKQ